MSILITNDDGITARGIAALEGLAQRVFPNETVYTVAPDGPYSECGHRVTTGSALTVTEGEKNRFAVNGTPADCVRIALYALDLTPSWVLSGINAGGNLGQDLYISGTAAGAREASFHGIRSVAFSQYRRTSEEPPHSESAERASLALREILERDLALEEGKPWFWNVNLPHPASGDPAPKVIETIPSRLPLPVAFNKNADGAYSYAGTYQDRPRESGSDIDVCFSGDISLSRVEIKG